MWNPIMVIMKKKVNMLGTYNSLMKDLLIDNIILLFGISKKLNHWLIINFTCRHGILTIIVYKFLTLFNQSF